MGPNPTTTFRCPILTRPKTANIETLEELLLVKGVTREILYGDGRKKGLIDFLTVFGTGKININAAPKEVLMAIPGMTADMVEEIINYRQKQEIKIIQEIGGSVVHESGLDGSLYHDCPGQYFHD